VLEDFHLLDMSFTLFVSPPIQGAMGLLNASNKKEDAHNPGIQTALSLYLQHPKGDEREWLVALAL
jgi:hypothetical protein